MIVKNFRKMIKKRKPVVHRVAKNVPPIAVKTRRMLAAESRIGLHDAPISEMQENSLDIAQNFMGIDIFNE